MRKILADRLMTQFRDFATKDWPWCADHLSYDNARLSEALLLSGQWLPDREMLEMGLRSLDWLKRVQTDEAGRHFAAIGNQGWFTLGGEKARFDRLNWFQGENDLRVPLYDDATGGCRDGLEAQGANENQGAESSLCWLMALLDIYNHRGCEQPTPGEEPARLDTREAS
jgi:hypothetical protein